MTEIRPARAADALRLAGQLAQLGYPSEPDAVTSRLAGILKVGYPAGRRGRLRGLPLGGDDVRRAGR